MTLETARPVALIVEDDASIRDYLALGLGYEGYEVEQASSGSEALERLSGALPDVVILDLGLPGLSGLSVLESLRQRSQLPVLILTARDGVEDRIAGLKAGADDYLVKPFHFGELAARLQAVLRRTRPVTNRVLRYADLTLDVELREAQRGGVPLELTPRALDLLAAFMAQPERALAKATLLSLVWGPDFLGDDNIVEVYVRQLRRALGEPDLIHTVRGAGYALRQR